MTKLSLVLALVMIYGVYTECVDSGLCLSCSAEMIAEKRKECVATGRRMEMKCKDDRLDYRSCDVRDDQLQVILFQIFMGIIGSCANWGVHTRKLRNMSLFDKRRKSSSSTNFLAI